MPKQASLFSSDDSYIAFLSALKTRIRTAQVQAALAINQEMIMLYWHIGREITSRQQQQGWGARIIEQLAKDLKREFPQMTGLSLRNLKYMKAFAEAYPDEQIVQRSVAQLPWRHNIALLEKLKSTNERLWYAQKAIENGWSRDILAIQIETKLHERQGGAISNFARTLPAPQSDLAQQLVKDSYHLNFLSLGPSVQERELEKALVDHIRDFLLELGVGFAFVGNQYRIEVSNNEYLIDLLFYHLKLRCFVVIDLKVTEFKPEYSGKMNFYISAVDDILRHPDDNPTIGIVLCRSKDRTIAEYALRNINTPMAVATHQLPAQFQQSLPSVEQLQMELDAALSDLNQNQKEQ